jgi:lipid II isoglutaminyl synthase (glutamine-hydrolysing)
MPNKFYITHLYPKEMSIYGDMGNIVAMKHILAQIGWETVYQTVEAGEDFPEYNDWIFVGGGQDEDQLKITEDFLSRKEKIKELVEDGVAILAICGGYQLLGQEFVDGNGEKMEGLGIFPVVTKSMDASVKSRCIGNIVIESELLACKLVGFENHGGQTSFVNSDDKKMALGKVITGYGNNFKDKIEGCVYKNAVGTYLHGSCLPKNPELTMWFIDKVIERKKEKDQVGFGLYYMVKEAKVNTEIAKLTKETLVQRFGK